MTEPKPTILRQHTGPEPKNRRPELLCFRPGCPHRLVYLESQPSRGYPGSGRWATRFGRLSGLGAGLSWWHLPQANPVAVWRSKWLPLTVRFLCAESEERSSADTRVVAYDSSVSLRVGAEGSS